MSARGSRRRCSRLAASVLLSCLAGACGGTERDPLDTEAPFVVGLNGAEYRWQVRYPGADGRFGTSDDLVTLRDVRVPAGTDVELRLTSDDYLYTLSLPHLGLKEIAVPEMTFRVRFDTGDPGSFELRGDPMCGYDHGGLLGRLIVMSPPAFEIWFREASESSRE